MSEPTTAAPRRLTAAELDTLELGARSDNATITFHGDQLRVLLVWYRLAIEAEARAEGAAEVARLREALRTYGAHQSGCDLTTDWNLVTRRCTCGFHEARAALAATPEPAPAPLDVDARNFKKLDERLRSYNPPYPGLVMNDPDGGL